LRTAEVWEKGVCTCFRKTWEAVAVWISGNGGWKSGVVLFIYYRCVQGVSEKNMGGRRGRRINVSVYETREKFPE
tara:strand:+ start:466 stop:690 length:225 start_codon:yes stop_codon:yes gene_type:complete